jgi:hypothetical protein
MDLDWLKNKGFTFATLLVFRTTPFPFYSSATLVADIIKMSFFWKMLSATFSSGRYKKNIDGLFLGVSAT